MSAQQDFSSLIFMTDVRLSFPHLIEPQKTVDQTSGKERSNWNCEFIMPPAHAAFAAFMARYGVLAAEKWKEHANTIMGMIHNERKQRCYGYGSEKVNKKSMLPYDGYVDNYYISVGRDTPPQMIDLLGNKIEPENTLAYMALARKMYGGCRVNAAIRPWLQDNKHGRGIRADLISIQFNRDDVPFGEGAIDASAMFGAVAGAAAPVNTAPAAAMPGLPFATAPAVGGMPGMPGMTQQVAGAPPVAAGGMPNFGAPAGMPSFLTGK